MTPRTVLLINPRVCKPHNARLPLSVLAIAAALEGRYRYHIIDANLDRDPLATAHALIVRERISAIGVSVMPGPQVVDAVALSLALRAAHPSIPIVWGGYFPTLYTDAAMNAPYVDFAVRGPGEETLLELLERLDDGPDAFTTIEGLTWKRDGEIVHNPQRRPRPPGGRTLPYAALGDLAPYHRGTMLGARTSVHEAAIGCRHRCNFCGVASMFGGMTALAPPEHLWHHLTALRDRHGVSSIIYYDNNFFDSEAAAEPLLDVLAAARLPYWCYGRADTLATLSASGWRRVRRGQLRMVYIGAESSDDVKLRRLGKGARAEYTFEAAIKCREHGVIPELSFILGGADDPEDDVDRTFAYIRRIKRRIPEAEIILYFHTPMPRRDSRAGRDGFEGREIVPATVYGSGAGGPALPMTPEGWTDPRWVRYVCHADAPWLTPRLRRRVNDFSRVLTCRFPTVQDVQTPRWGKHLLSTLARWRYATGIYHYPVELTWLHKQLRLRVPQAESL